MNDNSEIQRIQERLKELTRELHDFGPMAGMARQVIEFSSDLRKNCLAKHQRKYIERGEGVAGSEALARSDPLYLEAIKAVQMQVTEAFQVKAKWEATMASFEAARSLLAMNREVMHKMPIE
jgi:hypothetical protein